MVSFLKCLTSGLTNGWDFVGWDFVAALDENQTALYTPQCDVCVTNRTCLLNPEDRRRELLPLRQTARAAASPAFKTSNASNSID